MTAAPALLHSIALSACLILQAMPGSTERPSGIRRALQTLSAEQREPRAMAVSAEALHPAGSIAPA
ncbi:hypothetical protein ACFPOD_03195 [Nitratireductor kimnyeongensis]|uniref:Uncharacterized protein n=1 Tax=Nitratireductor kimnyeongensis TaxID=430679 RepID=A0ABW0T4I6_9HYPH|nr:hypothetical protein [Nitratireductor kimnyeongensis]QZZ34888.1 hypothetical protein KW403_13990 [Nitratireductor kimnyeongensis]